LGEGSYIFSYRWVRGRHIPFGLEDQATPHSTGGRSLLEGSRLNIYVLLFEREKKDLSMALTGRVANEHFAARSQKRGEGEQANGQIIDAQKDQ